MLRVDSKTPGDIVSRKTREGLTVYLSRPFEKFFPVDRFNRYEDFAAPSGDVLKNEARTVITRSTIKLADRSGTFVTKAYRYPASARWRAWYPQSIAHAEFSALSHLRHRGFPCVTPVACGMRRTWYGTVESCFLITENAEGFSSLRAWFENHPSPTPEETSMLADFARALGKSIREMHTQRLFVSRLSAKNILVRFASGSVEWLLIDHPAAGFYRYDAAARFMQAYDLGRLKNSLIRYGQEALFEEFLQAYSPDPFGKSDAVLRERVAYGVDIRQNRTPFLRAFHEIKGIFKPNARMR